MFPLFHPSLLSAAALLGMAGNFNQTGTDGQPCCGAPPHTNPCNDCDPQLLMFYHVEIASASYAEDFGYVGPEGFNICAWDPPFEDGHRLFWDVRVNQWTLSNDPGPVFLGPTTPCDPTGNYTDGTNTAVVS